MLKKEKPIATADGGSSVSAAPLTMSQYLLQDGVPAEEVAAAVETEAGEDLDTVFLEDLETYKAYLYVTFYVFLIKRSPPCSFFFFTKIIGCFLCACGLSNSATLMLRAVFSISSFKIPLYGRIILVFIRSRTSIQPVICRKTLADDCAGLCAVSWLHTTGIGTLWKTSIFRLVATFNSALGTSNARVCLQRPFSVVSSYRR
jgi:hypothetical protein